MNKKILILDDMQINRSLIKSFLMSIGQFDVDTAEDGLVGLKLLETNTYDAIFSDIEMPNMNGFEFLAKVKRNLKYKNIPVVMLSTLNKEEHFEKAKSLGAAHYIVKPFTKEKMDEALKKIGLK